jgi:hypothetical protein
MLTSILDPDKPQYPLDKAAQSQLRHKTFNWIF